MAVKSVNYLANGPSNTTPNTERGPSEVIWGAPGTPNAWVEDFLQDPRLGMYFFDDFLTAGYASASGGAFTGSLGQWSIYMGSTASIADGGIIGGGLQFVPASIAVSSGTSTPTTALTSQTGAFQITTASTNASCLQSRLAFEARVMLTSVTDVKRAAFVGLTDQGTPASGNPFLVVSGGSSNELTSTRNLIGFYNPSSGLGADWQFVYQLASTAPVFVTNLASLVSTVLGSAIGAGTFYKLGFVFNPFANNAQIVSAANGQTAGTVAKAMLTVYVNGVEAGAFLTQAANILTASFPTGIMGPCIAFANVSNSGTSNSATSLSGKMTVDWIRIAQNALT